MKAWLYLLYRLVRFFSIKQEPPNDVTTKAQRGLNRKSRLSAQSNSSATTIKSPNNLLNESKLTVVSGAVVNKPPDTTAKRNKQQRQFNTFVRESINQLLGPDFMRTHDVQDIDAQVMEMIRSKFYYGFIFSAVKLCSTCFFLPFRRFLLWTQIFSIDYYEHSTIWWSSDHL